MKKVINGNLVTLNADKDCYYSLIPGSQHNYEELKIQASDIVEDYTPQIDGLNIIVNGSINKNITETQLSKCDTYTKKHALWSMIIDTLEENREVKKYADITGTPENISLIFKAYERSEYKKRLTKKEKQQKEGAEAYEFSKKVSFNMDFNFDIEHAVGYLRAQGNWNEFNSGRAITELRKMDKTAPSYITDSNNPNQGIKTHTITILRNGAYIVFKWDYIGSYEYLEDIKNWFNSCKQNANRMDADSYRIETEKHPLYEGSEKCSYSAEVVLWWD